MYLSPEEADTESRDKWNKYFFATNVYSKIPGLTLSRKDDYATRHTP